jgi:hypothetical protein
MKVLLSDNEADAVTMNFPLTASKLDDPTDKGKAKSAQVLVRSQLLPEEKERKEKHDECCEKETGGTKTRFSLTNKERLPRSTKRSRRNKSRTGMNISVH